MSWISGGTAIVIGLAVASSCLIDRRTSDFECDDMTDCTSDRTCVDGFCIIDDSCPPGCDNCDRDNLTCNANCNSPNECGAFVCPMGFDCTIHCSASDACSSIDCSQATDCDITCDKPSACGNIDCGTGDCKVECNGTNACGAVDCSNSCECDVDCNSGDCGSFACPTTGADCTDGNNDGCDHTQSGCSTCP